MVNFSAQSVWRINFKMPKNFTYKYTYKIEDYGGGKFCFVISRFKEAIFHSNGYSTKLEAEIQAKSYVVDFIMHDEI
jgi:hypothetical protein